MQKVNLGYLSWNPLNWFKERSEEPIPGVEEVDFTRYAVLSEYEYIPGVGYVPAEVTPGRGAAPSGASPGTTTGSWLEPFLTTAEKIFGAYSNYQVSSAQSAKDAQAMKLQYDLALAQVEAAPKKPITINWATIAKTALLVGGVGLGVYLVAKK